MERWCARSSAWQVCYLREDSAMIRARRALLAIEADEDGRSLRLFSSLRPRALQLRGRGNSFLHRPLSLHLSRLSIPSSSSFPQLSPLRRVFPAQPQLDRRNRRLPPAIGLVLVRFDVDGVRCCRGRGRGARGSRSRGNCRGGKRRRTCDGTSADGREMSPFEFD